MNCNLTKSKFLLSGFVMLFLVHLAKAQLVIDLELKVPPLVEDAGLYMATDFTDWLPGPREHQFRKIDSSHYRLVLVEYPEEFEYKFTQGTWATTEGTPGGQALPNRSYSAKLDGNHITATILGWEERIAYTIVVKSIPEKTPPEARIYITGNFNNWKPGDKAYQLKSNIDGTYRTKVYSDLDHLEFKFTRGNWETVEARQSGKARPNRRIDRDTTPEVTNLEFTIEGWEDLHGAFSFYSFYDLLLLFSVFQGILLLIAIPSLQSNNRSANRWLLSTIALSSFGILFYLLSNFDSAVQHFPKVLFLGDAVLFLYAPLFYFYLRALLFNASGLPSRWWLHFIPAILQLIVYLPFVLESDSHMLDRIMNQEELLVNLFVGSGLLAFIWNAYYWNLFRKTINVYKEQFKTNFSYEQNLSYLQTVLIIQFLCLILWLAFFTLLFLSRTLAIDTVNLQENLIDLIWLTFSVITYILGYFAITHPETFKAEPAPISIFDDILESSVLHGKVLPKESETSENLQPVIEELEKNLAQNKPYINPKLTLSELAHQINVPPHLLSKAINEHYGKNFFEFINTLRIEEFKELIKQPKYHNYTLLALAYEVGFNSKTAFNRAFKKITDKTPKEYFEAVLSDQEAAKE